MKRDFRFLDLWVLSALALVSVCTAQQTNSTAVAEPNQTKAAVITCSGMIDDGLYQSIKRRSAQAIAKGAEYIILEIGTYGGRVDSADNISKFLILDLGQKVHTAAYITTEAISAGAMISVSCQDIIMKKNTTIGDCAPIQMGDKLEGVEREKAESFIRATFKRAAEANNYPAVLLEAMVSRHKKVWQVKNLHSGIFEFFEAEKLPTDANTYDLSAKELLVSDNEILTLTAKKAAQYNIARAVVNNIDGAVEFLQSRDSVEFSAPLLRLEPNWSEQMVRMLNHPSLTGILFMVAMLGVYMELKTPGLGLPGLVAVICFAILFGSRFLVGMATWWEMAVFAIGIVLLLAEIFVIPGFGIAGIGGILCILLGLFAILIPNRPDELPWPKYNMDFQLLTNGTLGLASGFVGFIVIAYFIAKFLPKTSAFSGLVLPANNIKPDEDGQLKIGDTGRVITPLRPIGEAMFGSKAVDVVAEAEFIEKDAVIEIYEIHGNRIVVKKKEN